VAQVSHLALRRSVGPRPDHANRYRFLVDIDTRASLV
jgi:hypothetical protein